MPPTVSPDKSPPAGASRPAPGVCRFPRKIATVRGATRRQEPTWALSFRSPRTDGAAPRPWAARSSPTPCARSIPPARPPPSTNPTGAATIPATSAAPPPSPRHFRRLIEAGLPSPDAAVSVARAGLGSLYRQMRVVDDAGGETGLDEIEKRPSVGGVPATVTV